MNNDKKMTDDQKRALYDAISQLDEEDQSQIAGGYITNVQCEKIKKIVNKSFPIAIRYGCISPLKVDWLIKKDTKEIIKKDDDISETTKIVPVHPTDSGSEI